MTQPTFDPGSPGASGPFPSREQARKDDAKIRTSIRTELARLATHPASVGVAVHDGHVTLSGPVFDHEVERLVEAVRNVAGVRAVERGFEILFATHDGLNRLSKQDSFRYQPDFIVGSWAPWLRALAGSAGALLLLRGLRKHDAASATWAALGTLLVARAATNQELTRLLGTFVLPVLSLRRTVRVEAPVDDVYDFWSHFANYPRFMSYIREVQVNDTGGLRWTADAPGGTKVSWDTTVLELSPNRRIAWKSVRGSLIATEGDVQFDALGPQSSRLTIELSYAPPAGAIGYAVAHLLGFDPRERIDEDLEVMRMLIERQDRSRSESA